jgi:hypothetical protein
MSMRRTRVPKTNPSQENLDYIDRETRRSAIKPDRSKLREASKKFKQFVEGEKKASDGTNK